MPHLLPLCVLLVAGTAFAGPKIALVFDEQVRGVMGLSGNWVDVGRGEEIILSGLRAAGWDPLDPKVVRTSLLKDQAVQLLAGDQKAAALAAARLPAPILITGQGYAKASGQVAGSSMKSVQGTVQLTATEAGTGKILASATGGAAKPHIDEVIGGGEAIAAAATEAVQKLTAALREVQVQPGAGRPLQVTVNGLKSYRHYLFLKQWIEGNTPGFKGLDEETYTTGTADFALRAGVTGPAFAEKIALEKFDGFSVNPVDVAEDKVTLKVILAQER
jgi:hypothetical protein